MDKEKAIKESQYKAKINAALIETGERERFATGSTSSQQASTLLNRSIFKT
jgi:hypothetical protein